MAGGPVSIRAPALSLLLAAGDLDLELSLLCGTSPWAAPLASVLPGTGAQSCASTTAIYASSGSIPSSTPANVPSAEHDTSVQDPGASCRHPSSDNMRRMRP